MAGRDALNAYKTRRRKDSKEQNPEFADRESLLTVLIENSLHIRVIYHIFLVILLILLFDTFLYDLLEHGKINLGLRTISNGFKDIKRSLKLWIYELTIALLFYPGLRIYAAGFGLFKPSTGMRMWKTAGIIGVIVLQGTLIALPVIELIRRPLAVASSAIVTCEMIRLFMKIHAVAVACASRCHDHYAALPTFTHFIYYLFAPTLLYRDHYPRTKTIRWKKVVGHFLEVAAIVFFVSFMWGRFIQPMWYNYGKNPQVEVGLIIRNIFMCTFLGVMCFLCGNYCILHAWLNAFAELLRFGDRLFYEDWWTKSQFSKFYRTWNRVVHLWLRDHIYKIIAPRYGRTIAIFVVFMVSSVVHEVVLAFSFGFFYPVLFVLFGVIGLSILPLTYTSGQRHPKILNLLLWLSFFFGNGLLYSLYTMEYYARKNCPPSEHDSFFIPKSWSCPEIVFKPNWKLQFEIL